MSLQSKRVSVHLLSDAFLLEREVAGQIQCQQLCLQYVKHQSPTKLQVGLGHFASDNHYSTCGNHALACPRTNSDCTISDQLLLCQEQMQGGFDNVQGQTRSLRLPDFCKLLSSSLRRQVQ